MRLVTFIEPITNGIDKSKPPNIATKVCPTVAKPRNAAKTNIDFIFINVKKPGIVSDPIINNPIKTDIPTKTLLVPLINTIDDKIEKIATKSISEHGTGGMKTKIDAAKVCQLSGCHMAIANWLVKEKLIKKRKFY